MAIIERVEKFDFSSVEFKDELPLGQYGDGFLVKIRLNVLPKTNERELLVRCPFFEIYAVRLHIDTDKDKFTRLERQDDIGVYADGNGFVYLLEIKASFLSPYQKEPRETTVDLPLNLFDASKRCAYAYFDGVKLGWVFDAEARNLDYTFGALVEDLEKDAFVCNGVEFGVANSFLGVKKEIAQERVDKSMDFYSPRGYNAWVGDVMNFYHDGVYHLLCLYDRHHHASRWGGGAHGVYHFTTQNFVDWTEQPPIFEIDEEWKSVGTGTMFFHNGKYYFSHGLHTSRMVPVEKTGSSSLQKQPRVQERIVPVSYAELKEEGLYPSGANYMLSSDGIHFETGERIFHIGENPSVYLDENGGLFAFMGYGATGIWRAKSVDSEWVLDEKTEIPQSKLNPTTECPSLFELNGYKYLIMGFTGYWKTDKNGGIYHDEGIDGFDIYDGLAVPMVAKTDDNRLILSGWISGEKWGSVIAHRELCQAENGRLYSKWLKELAPKTDELNLIAKDERVLALDERKSYYFELDISAKENTKIFARFSGCRDNN